MIDLAPLTTIAIVSFVALAQVVGAPTVNNVWQFLGLCIVVGLQAWSLWLNHQNKAAIGEVKAQTNGLTDKLVNAAGKVGEGAGRDEIRAETKQDIKDARAEGVIQGTRDEQLRTSTPAPPPITNDPDR